MAGSVVQDGHSSRNQNQEAFLKDAMKDDKDSTATEPKSPFFLRRLWDKLGLNIGLVLTMIK